MSDISLPQIVKACQGRYRSSGGLNVDDLKRLVGTSHDTSFMSRAELLAIVCKGILTEEKEKEKEKEALARSDRPAARAPAPAPAPVPVPAPARAPAPKRDLQKALYGEKGVPPPAMTVEQRRQMLRCGNKDDLDAHPCCATTKDGDKCSYVMCPTGSCEPHCDYIRRSSILANIHKAPEEVKMRLKKQFDKHSCSRRRRS